MQRLLFRVVEIRLREYPPQNRFEELQRFTGIFRVEAVLIVIVAKIDCVLVPRMIAETFARVTVAAVMMRVILHLEQAVMTDDPVETFRYEGTQDRGGHLAV